MASSFSLLLQSLTSLLVFGGVSREANVCCDIIGGQLIGQLVDRLVDCAEEVEVRL